MPACKECKWMDVHPVKPDLGECKIEISPSRRPAHIVKVNADASKCKYFQPKEEKRGQSIFEGPNQ